MDPGAEPAGWRFRRAHSLQGHGRMAAGRRRESASHLRAVLQCPRHSCGNGLWARTHLGPADHRPAGNRLPGHPGQGIQRRPALPDAGEDRTRQRELCPDQPHPPGHQEQLLPRTPREESLLPGVFRPSAAGKHPPGPAPAHASSGKGTAISSSRSRTTSKCCPTSAG